MLFGQDPPIAVLKRDIGLGDFATENTARAIADHIRLAQILPIVRGTAENLVRPVRERAYLDEIRRIFNWVKRTMRFTKDPYKREMFKEAAVHLREIRQRGRGYGDCDDHAVLLGALLASIGHRVRVVIVQSPWNRSGGFNHVYLEAVVNGKTISLDATAKDKPMGFRPARLREKTFEV